MLVFDLLDGILGEIGDILRGFDSQCSALSLSPAFQAPFNLSFVTLFCWLVEIGAQDAAGEILLGQEVFRVFMRVLVILAVSQGFAIPV